MFNNEFMKLYEELSELNEMFLGESAIPVYTSDIVDLSTCREIVSSKYNKLQGGYESNCVTQVNDQLSRIEVRVFILKKEAGQVYFLGRKCNRSTGYTTPGGGFDLTDRTPVETAKRELREELNMTLTNVQESSVHTFYSLPRCSWVNKYVENPEDRWTGYYQYYVTAEYAGESDNDRPEELGKFSWLPISVFENPADKAGALMLKIINGHSWANTSEEQLAEAFGDEGSEVIYGEASKTIPGIVRYFVPDINTLGKILGRNRIKVSTEEETDPDTRRGTKQFAKFPYVSFSHQLFSHAYRAPSKWKFGVALDQSKLEKAAQRIQGTRIKDNFVHDGHNMRMYGAARCSDGTDLIISNFGHFAINLSDDQREMSSVEKTDFYNLITKVFNDHLDALRQKHPDNLYSCTEDTEEITKFVSNRLDLSSEIIEGYLLRPFCRLASVGLPYVDLCAEVPGLREFLQNNTPLNEGELRIWMPKNCPEYLDISGCIVGIVLPSNYKEDYLDNEMNTSPDALWLRKLVKEKDLTLYVYTSKDESNMPNIDLSKKRSHTLARPSIAEYFHKITSSKEAAINFIHNELPKYCPPSMAIRGLDLFSLYSRAVAKMTTTTATTDVYSMESYNYAAFKNALLEFALTEKDIINIYYTGESLPNALEVYKEKTKDLNSITEFLKLLNKEYPNKALIHAYAYWFTHNTNATMTSGKYTPNKVSWASFLDYCRQKYNFTASDLTSISRGREAESRESINSLFKKAAGTSKNVTLKFIKLFAATTQPALSQCYNAYMGKHAIDTSSMRLSKDTQYNYTAWLTAVTDPNGPVKLTKEEISAYFKECKNNNQTNM